MSDPFAPLPKGTESAPAKAQADWRPIMPVPQDAPAPPRHYKHGEPSRVWEYRDAAGRLLFRVCRFDLPNGKEVIPQSYCQGPRGREWRWKAPPEPRPLYGLDRLAARPQAPVVVTEGEKAADAAAELLPDHVAIASQGGNLAAKKADWTPLAGRRVVIWPDADAPGAKYAAAVAAELAKL